MASIGQNRYPDRLPDFLNAGVWARSVLLVTALCFAASLARAPHWQAVPDDFVEVVAVTLPALVLWLLAAAALNRLLQRLSYAGGLSAAAALAVLCALGVRQAASWMQDSDVGDAPRQAALALFAAAAVLGFFHLRGRALSPALTEARLQALQARIRPHFLFNSINAVLSLVRTEPRRAEAALQDMAELFRVLMADNRQLVPLADEVRLCRQYLELEQLRLGERLRVQWHADKMPRDAMMPPLVLQPLLENAVNHGVESSAEPGVVSINIYEVRGEVHVMLRNPYRQDGAHHCGNKMAIGNIRERLALHFDAEAALESRVREGAYQVHIRFPYVRAPAPADEGKAP
ncbi:MAG: sensor histidine kinase [Betaproteobacteria bacterium]